MRHPGKQNFPRETEKARGSTNTHSGKALINPVQPGGAPEMSFLRQKVANLLGLTLHRKGDLDGALSYLQRALRIDEKIYGLDHASLAISASNIGLILKAKGDLDGALTYTQRALQIDEKVYGPEHPTVAISANNIGQILKDKGDLDGALSYCKRTLKILKDHYGPDSPKTKTVAANVKKIEEAKEAKQH